MIRKITSMLAAFAIAIATLAPAAADARDRRGHGGYYDRGHHGYYGRHRDHDGDEVAAGVIGLVLGLAIGSAASQPRYDRRYDRCYDRCAPPPPRRCYDPCDRSGYYDQGYDQGYYDPRYDDPRAQYERGYELEGEYYDERRRCTQQVRRWDDYANRYVIVNVPC